MTNKSLSEKIGSFFVRTKDYLNIQVKINFNKGGF